MSIPALVAARIAALVFAAAAMLSACTVDVEQPRPPYGPQSGYCTREYAPVCARRGGDRQTFDNGCLAEEAGYRILRGGECRNRGDDYGDNDYGGGGGGVVIETACSKDLNPVCARRGNDQRTFVNDCRAEEAGFRVIYGGECRVDAGGGDSGGAGGGGGGGGGGSQECSKEYVPVCANKYGRNQTFPNACRALASDYRIVHQGEC